MVKIDVRVPIEAKSAQLCFLNTKALVTVTKTLYEFIKWLDDQKQNNAKIIRNSDGVVVITNDRFYTCYIERKI